VLILYPSNWLYNAGVSYGENVENFLKDDGSVEIDLSLFDKIKIGSAEIPKFIKGIGNRTSQGFGMVEVI
jgi:CRISPR/Cas system endoribonuclease Cas6 (RAMP superfamily)